MLMSTPNKANAISKYFCTDFAKLNGCMEMLKSSAPQIERILGFYRLNGSINGCLSSSLITLSDRVFRAFDWALQI